MKNTSALAKNPRSRALHCVLIAATTASFIGTAAMAGEAQLSVANVSVPEGNSGTTQMNFSVVRSGDSSTNIAVPYSVPPGTAKANEDYQRPANNTILRIPAGFTQGIVRVPVNGDTRVEQNETLKLQLGQPAAYDSKGEVLVAPTYAATPGPTSLLAADFNGDGVADLAMTTHVFNASLDQVSVLLGRISGGFGNPTTYSVESGSSSIATADFNGDGTLDLAVANSGSRTISILLGTREGRFGNATDLRLNAHPATIAVADFNGDGRPDLALTYYGPRTFSILLGQGNGRFQKASIVPISIEPATITIADFNRDGRPDVTFASIDSNKISVLLGNGSGGFGAETRYPAKGPSTDIVAGDFDSDGVADLIVATQGRGQSNNGFSLLRGDGNGGFGPPTNFAKTVGNIEAGDFNGDGKLDLALAGYGGIAVRLGDGSGGFDAGRNFGPPGLFAIVDSNRDGKSDLVVASSDNVSVLLSNGDGSFAAAEAFAISDYAQSLLPADFDGDGVTDLIAMSTVTSILRGKGDGTFAPTTRLDVSAVRDTVVGGVVGDFNGDGAPDLAFSDSLNDNVVVFLNDGSGGFAAAERFPAGDSPRSIATVDLNRDGRLDLVTTNYDVKSLSVLLGNGAGRFGEPIVYADAGDHPMVIATADFNNDGKPDVAVAHPEGHSISIFLGNGLGSFGRRTKFPVGDSPVSIAPADLNGDGIPDLAVANSIGKSISILLGLGDGNFSAATNFALTGGSTRMAIAAIDVNGDGTRDLEVTGVNSQIAILTGDGNGGFGEAKYFMVAGGSICAADFNGDGKRDLAVSSEFDVAILLNSPTDTAVLSNSSATGTILNDD